MSQSPNPAVSFFKKLALMSLAAMPQFNLAQPTSTGTKCSTARYYGKTFSKLQNPRKKRGGTKKKFHRQKKK